MIISLLGYMGSGKSTIGKHLAERLGFLFTDLDEEILQKSTFPTISEIFNQKGALYFRKLEQQALTTILDSNVSRVLALGGGTPCYYDNIKQLNNQSKTIYLKASPSFLAQRLWIEKENRPILSNLNEDSFKEFIAKHLFERNPFYNQAQHILNIEGKTVIELVDKIALR